MVKLDKYLEHRMVKLCSMSSGRFNDILDPDPGARHYFVLQIESFVLRQFGKWTFFPQFDEKGPSPQGLWDAIGYGLDTMAYLVQDQPLIDPSIYIMYDILGQMYLLGKLSDDCELHRGALPLFKYPVVAGMSQ